MSEVCDPLEGQTNMLEPLNVVKEPSFENYLTSNKAREILKHETFNTVTERFEEDVNGDWMRVPYFSQYIQIPFKWNLDNWEEKKENALKKLAECYEKAVELELVSLGCLTGGACSMKTVNNTAMVFIWPMSKYNWKPKEFNDKMGGGFAFKGEGQLSYNGEIDFD